MTVELKRGPCGEVPKKVLPEYTGCAKYMLATPSCCSEWLIELRANYHDIDSEACQVLAVEAWNNATRGNEK